MAKEAIKLTEKEQAAISALLELVKTWPKSLKMGGDCDSKYLMVWKKKEPGVHMGVAKIKIENMDY